MENNEENIKQEFNNIVEKTKPKPKIFKNCLFAFVVGGAICDVGQLFQNLFTMINVPAEDVSTYVAIVMVFIGAFLTGVGIYDKIAAFAGAGSVVPITGFANSIVSPAMEYKKEGFVFGVGAKMFTIAGPVLVYGISSSFVVGIIYYFINRW
ncbi:MAG: stage V sporulation protein AC [Bacillota bacterium]|nr:stage V sporulation protein AC [Bacillota bacterium]